MELVQVSFEKVVMPSKRMIGITFSETPDFSELELVASQVEMPFRFRVFARASSSMRKEPGRKGFSYYAGWANISNYIF